MNKDNKCLMEKIAVFFSICLIVLTGGCSNSAAQDEILNYINQELPHIAELETTVQESYNSVLGEGYTNDYVAHEELVSTTLPALNTLESYVNNLQIDNSDLKEVHKIYINYVRAFKNSVITTIGAIENQDSSKIVEANNYMYEAQDITDQFITELKKLCQKYNIVLNGTN